MSQPRKYRLKSLLDDLPQGFIADTAWIKARGIDSKSIHNYVEQGWLEKIIWGVYLRPLPTSAGEKKLPWQIALLSMQHLMGYDVHLGGENALNFLSRGNFSVPGEERQVHLYGNVPSWIKRLPTTGEFILHKSTLFGDNSAGIADRHQISYKRDLAADVWQWPMRISLPERAVLEMIADLQANSDFAYVGLYFQSLRHHLRPELLMKLLKACRSIKVRRLFFAYADIYQYSWRKDLDTSQIDFGSGPRVLVPGGKLHPIYQISLPRNFSDFVTSGTL